MNSTRRTFFKQIAGFMVLSGGLQMFLSACGSSASSGGNAGTNAGTGNCATNGTTVSIGTNHGHVAPVISAADVAAGAQTQYSLGASDVSASPPSHTHTVTLTAATFSALKGNMAQVVTTDTDTTGHYHLVSIGCA